MECGIVWQRKDGKWVFMHTLPLQFNGGYLFTELSGHLWLVATGSPTSFGPSGQITFADKHFALAEHYLDLNAESLPQFTGVPCHGMIGANILDHFDFIFDAARGKMSVSAGELTREGERLHTGRVMGLPVLTVKVEGTEVRMLFDTRSRLSFFQSASQKIFSPAGRATDFYPGFGQFETDTHHVPAQIGSQSFTLRCGKLPDLIGFTLMAATVEGIVGNAILAHRAVGFFPRRHTLVL